MQGGVEAHICERASGGGESLELVAVALKGSVSHLIGRDPDVEEEKMGRWVREGKWDLWDLIK